MAQDDRLPLEDWEQESRARWNAVSNGFPSTKGITVVAYRLSDSLKHLCISDFEKVLISLQEPDYSPFYKGKCIPNTSRNEIEYLVTENDFPSLLHRAEFWRASLDGNMFQIRAFPEDLDLYGNPGTKLNVDRVILHTAACLVHAARLTKEVKASPSEFTFHIMWEGLDGRKLSQEGNPDAPDFISRSSTTGDTCGFSVSNIESDLAGAVELITKPLFDLFESNEGTFSPGKEHFEKVLSRW